MCVYNVLLYSIKLHTEIMCVVLQDPTNGQVTMSGQTTGSLAAYTCDSGYELIGTNTRTCDNGEWTGEAPICTGM